ncbi:MAG TPA: M48 family metallopeptidase [Candidatus Nanoarchaeia archaeon]|nr:M48 family metallopeptidase [Candidatus Nanoarchaeia archaeon]
MKRLSFNDQIARNKRKSFFLIIIIFLVFLALGYVIAKIFAPGSFFLIMIIAIIFSLSYVFGTYYNSHKIAVKSVGAKPASRKNFPQYHSLVEGIAISSGMPKPDLYIMDSNQINAFATGRNPSHAVICVTKGAVEKLDKRELEAVIAHEMGHIANYDMRYMTIATVMVGLIAIISEIFLYSLWFSGGNGGGGGDNKGNIVFIIIGIALAILAPIIVQLVQASISRKREFSADASSAKYTRYPDALIRALEKIKNDQPTPYQNKNKKVNKTLAPLFFSNPFKNMNNLAKTHPPIEKRIEALKKM